MFTTAVALTVIAVSCGHSATISYKNHPSGSRTVPWSGTAAQSVGVPDGNGGWLMDSDSAPVSVSSDGDVSNWSLRMVTASYGGVSECLPAAMGSVTGAAPPSKLDQIFDKAVSLAERILP
jgi:hypothetical protein